MATVRVHFDRSGLESRKEEAVRSLLKGRDPKIVDGKVKQSNAWGVDKEHATVVCKTRQRQALSVHGSRIRVGDMIRAPARYWINAGTGEK